MPIFASTGFPGVGNTELSVAIPEFQKIAGFTANAQIDTGDGRQGLYCGAAEIQAFYFHSAVPPSADYAVRARVYRNAGGDSSGAAGVIARHIVGEPTFYLLQLTMGGVLQLQKYRVSFPAVTLGTVAIGLPLSSSVDIELFCEVVGATMRLTPRVNGALTTMGTAGVVIDAGAEGNNPITATGRSGLGVTELRELGVANRGGMDDWQAEDFAPAGPTITGPTTFNLAENDTTSGPLFSTDIALGSGYPTKTGADQALFNLVSVGTNQWRFVKIAGGNFEGPDDAGANRVYDVTFNASATVSLACAITLTNVAEPPGAPTIGTATAGDATVTIAGTAPAANGGPSVSSYLATLSPGGLTKTSATLPITLTSADGVVNGTAYTGTLRAINSEGTGPASAASNSVTPSSAPAPVRTVRTLPFSRNPGNGARPVSLPNNSVAVLADAAGLAPIVNQAGLAMGSDGRVQLDSSSLPASGTSVVVVTREADGKLGVERYQVQ